MNVYNNYNIQLPKYAFNNYPVHILMFVPTYYEIFYNIYYIYMKIFDF